MFRKLFLTAALTATVALAAPATGRAQGDQEWKLGVVISAVGVGDRGCVLNQVIDGSPAHKIGLEPGDTLLTVNGQLASDPLAVRSTIFANDTVMLVLKRGNSHFQIDVTFETPNNNQSNNGGVPTGGTVMMAATETKAVKSVKTSAVGAPNLANAKPLGNATKPLASPKPPAAAKSPAAPKPPAATKPAVRPTPKPVPNPAPKTPNANR